jgi:hypothetical protein
MTRYQSIIIASQEHDTTKTQIDRIRKAYKDKLGKAADKEPDGLWKFLQVPDNGSVRKEQVPVIERMIRVMSTYAAGFPYINQKDVIFNGKPLGFSDEEIVDFIRPAIEEGIIRAADGGKISHTLYATDELPRTAPVVEIDPTVLVDVDGNPLDITKAKYLRKWISRIYKGREIIISDDNFHLFFTREGIEDSLKGRDETHRKMYAAIDKLIISGIYDSENSRSGDKRLPDVEKQYFYHSVARIGDKLYSITILINIPKSYTGKVNYYNGQS